MIIIMSHMTELLQQFLQKNYLPVTITIDYIHLVINFDFN